MTPDIRELKDISGPSPELSDATHCKICGKRLSSYNKTGECFCHGGYFHSGAYRDYSAVVPVISYY